MMKIVCNAVQSTANNKANKTEWNDDDDDEEKGQTVLSGLKSKVSL